MTLVAKSLKIDPIKGIPRLTIDTNNAIRLLNQVEKEPLIEVRALGFRDHSEFDSVYKIQRDRDPLIKSTRKHQYHKSLLERGKGLSQSIPRGYK